MKLHNMGYDPNFCLLDRRTQRWRHNAFRKKITTFTRRVPVKNVKTLKIGLWVFSATETLRNLKLHHMDYGPNMSLCDDFRQNRRPKVFSENIAIFPRHVPVQNVKTLKTGLWVFSATDNLRNLKLHHIYNDPNMSL